MKQIGFDFNRRLSDELSKLTGYPLSEIERALQSRPLYRTTLIPKKNGSGVRCLEIPNDALMDIQRSLHKRFLCRLAMNAHVHGSVRRRDSRTHARKHLGQRAVYLIDLRDAFTQATKAMVAKAFMRRSVEAPVANLLAELVTLNDGLPQGAPTSNVVWNLVCADLDESCIRLAEEFALTYTRYTDEIVFSHPNHIGSEEMLRIRQLVGEMGFRINFAKTRYFHARSGAIPITGVSISGNRMKLTKRQIERIRGFIHRAIFDPSIKRSQVEGRLGQVRAIYGRNLPPRILEAYRGFWFRDRR